MKIEKSISYTSKCETFDKYLISITSLIVFSIITFTIYLLNFPFFPFTKRFSVNQSLLSKVGCTRFDVIYAYVV